MYDILPNPKTSKNSKTLQSYGLVPGLAPKKKIVPILAKKLMKK